MKNDPIVDEVRKTREKLWDECGGDMDKYMDRIQAAEGQYPQRLITREQMLARKHRHKPKAS